MAPRILFYCLLCCLLACQAPPPRQVTPAFYFWKQVWTGNSTERQYVKDLPAKRLYIRMFDVAPEKNTREPAPVAIFRKNAPLPDSVAIVPVVFLMNEIWAGRDSAAIYTLAQQVTRLLRDCCDSLHTATIPEIQLDCDWTQGSRDQYFTFIRAMRAQPFLQHKILSATIRMYQVKYRSRSGIPPVDKGLLMCYNMGDLRKPGDHNSILDETTLAAYIGDSRVTDYPLSLDIALPLFDWSVLFRGGQYAGILRSVDEKALQHSPLFAATGKYLYRVQKDTLFNGFALRAGDEIRRERCTPELLETAAHMISRQRQHHDPTVIFYHLDSVTLHNYPLDELQKIYRLFH
ncbi:hypothetical protein [Chitinophaga vietnamensis]|uniref:hypothetical protein n=1 Tax=Chitinophaga vietnamensis TaxID=2593957 RepID=UPI001177E2A3|nr:hypothetical protein [Chitinophaga vietnamensis]